MDPFLDVICSVCGDGFVGFFYSKYCSDECNPRTPKKLLIEFNCLRCNESVKSRRRKDFCSEFCRFDYLENFCLDEPQITVLRMKRVSFK